MKARTAIERVLDATQEGMLDCPKSRRLVVAVSGGRDSVVLLDALVRLGFRKLAVLHVNHSLRGRASGGDAMFVRRLAGRLGLPIVVAKVETRTYAASKKVSLELAARELRHAAYSAAAGEFKTPHLVLGHHAEDQIETCLFNYLRGSGPGGLTGMQQLSTFAAGPKNLMLHRPMLTVRRHEIDAYVLEAGLKFREDASNALGDFTRNRIRNELVPLIADIMGASFGNAVLRNAEILRVEHAYLSELAASYDREDEMLDVRFLRSLPLALQRRFIGKWLARIGPPECGFAETAQVLRLLPEGAPTAKVNLPAGAHCRRRAGKIFLEAPATPLTD